MVHSSLLGVRCPKQIAFCWKTFFLTQKKRKSALLFYPQKKVLHITFWSSWIIYWNKSIINITFYTAVGSVRCSQGSSLHLGVKFFLLSHFMSATLSLHNPCPLKRMIEEGIDDKGKEKQTVFNPKARDSLKPAAEFYSPICSEREMNVNYHRSDWSCLFGAARHRRRNTSLLPRDFPLTSLYERTLCRCRQWNADVDAIFHTSLWQRHNRHKLKSPWHVQILDSFFHDWMWGGRFSRSNYILNCESQAMAQLLILLLCETKQVPEEMFRSRFYLLQFGSAQLWHGN